MYVRTVNRVGTASHQARAFRVLRHEFIDTSSLHRLPVMPGEDADVARAAGDA